jgi:hypothetical protein
VPAGDYIEGLVVFGAVLAATAGASALICARRLPGLSGSVRALAFALVATLGLLAVHLVPMALGILSRGTVLVACALWALAAWALPRVEAAGGPAPGRRLSLEIADAAGWARAGWALAAVALGFVVALGVSVLSDHLTVAPLSIDVLNFHLPGVARWIETGSLWQIDVFLPGVAPGHYPQNGDVILLATVLPWRNDFLAHLAMYPFWALTGLGLYAVARELRAPAAAAIVVACVALVIPAVAVPALIGGLVDALALFAFVTGILFLLRHRRTGAGADLALAGLALGVAFGTKWYAVSSVAIVVGVWAVASFVDRRSARWVLAKGAALVGLIALAGGIWMLRNLVESSNPVFPVEVAPFGVEIFSAPRDIVRETAGFTLLDYVGDSGVWSEWIWPALRHTLAWPGLLIGIGFAVACGLVVARGRAIAGRGVLLVAAACALLLLLAYAATPYSAGGPEGLPVLVAADARYAVPALLVGAIVAAVAVSTAGLRWLAAAFGALALPALLDGARWSSGATNEAASLSPLTWGLAIVATAAVVLAWPRIAAAARPRLRQVALAGGAAALLIAAVGGYEVEKRFNDDRLLGGDPATDFVLDQVPAGTRVGLAGLWDDAGISPVLPSYGPRYENEVEYVGEFVDEMLRRYPNQEEFAAALERGDYDLLIVGRGRPEEPEVAEQEWARAAGYERLLVSERLALLVPEGPAG